jgi:hypothetical protein
MGYIILSSFLERVGMDQRGHSYWGKEYVSKMTEQKISWWEISLADGKVQTQPHQTVTF